MNTAQMANDIVNAVSNSHVVVGTAGNWSLHTTSLAIAMASPAGARDGGAAGARAQCWDRLSGPECD
jgi:hypothetical protein